MTTEYTVHHTHHSGWGLSHNVDNRTDLKALLDTLLDSGYTEFTVTTHEHEEAA